MDNMDVKTTVDGQETEGCEGTVVNQTDKPAETTLTVIPKEGRLKKFGRTCWNNRGKIGMAIGGIITFVTMCALGKDGGDNDIPDEGPTE